MKEFPRTSRLQTFPLHSRLVYSTFLVFTLAGVALTLWLAHAMVGGKLQRFDEYYAGKPAAAAVAGPPVATADDAAGPALDLPPDMLDQPTVVAEPMATRKLLEVTHFHLFSMPVFLLILAHIYVMGTATKRTKTFWVATATASMALHIIAPWLGAAGTTGAALAYGISGTGLVFSLSWMSLASLVEMWIPRRAATERVARANAPPASGSEQHAPAE